MTRFDTQYAYECLVKDSIADEIATKTDMAKVKIEIGYRRT
ncbi:MAG: hypothetical protein OXG24_06680 [Gammaproteobacteria bacterium]|nr:hypothetical protein [Gammaproteobacteria bacterium]